MTTSASLNSSSVIEKTRLLGLVAGEGKLPALLAKSAKERGYKIVAFALSEDAKASIESIVDSVHLIAPGQLGRNLKLMEKESVKQAVFIGKVPKLNLLLNIHKLDWVAIRELSRLPNLNDDTIQVGMGDIMERHGVSVLNQSDFLRHLFPEYGVLSKRQPNAAEYADIQFGIKVAKEIARLDIGQTVVVRDQMILAVEAIEGTDECIKRAVSLARQPVVVCKVAKANHDPRFDLPTVGMNTLNAMRAEKPGGVLAIGANETLVVEKEEMSEFCDRNGFSMVAV